VPAKTPVLAFMQRECGLDDHEAYGTLNMGAGFALYLEAEDADRAVADRPRPAASRPSSPATSKPAPNACVIEPAGRQFRRRRAAAALNGQRPVLITLKNVILRRSAKVLLNGANVTINPGEKVGLVGRNGAGKSTLFALFNGSLHEDSGDFYVPSAVAHGRGRAGHARNGRIRHRLCGGRRHPPACRCASGWRR
jgi:ABC-type multidrug transport system fused ATPase/permease subunit